MSRAIGGARPWSESAGRVGQRHMPPPPISALIDAPRQSNFRLRASLFAAIITTAATPNSHPDCRALLIKIVALYKRPHREREGLVHEQTRVVNRMKSALIQFGVRNFNPKLRKASVKLETVRTPEGKSLPPNTIAALRRDMERLRIIKEQIKAIEQARLQQFAQKPEALANRMIYLLVRIYGLGLETADLLVHELLSRTLRDRKAVARYAGLTGPPDESGSKRREKGLSRSGNARVRKIMIQLAWRMVKFQPDSALVQWFKQRTENAKGSRKPMIVALARKLIIALWRYANDGVIPEGFRLHSAA